MSILMSILVTLPYLTVLDMVVKLTLSQELIIKLFLIAQV